MRAYFLPARRGYYFGPYFATLTTFLHATLTSVIYVYIYISIHTHTHTHTCTHVCFVDRQIPEREQANGTVQVSEPDGGADQDMVPESAHQVEEAANVAAEDRAAAGTLSAGVLPEYPVSPFAVLRGTFDVRQPAAGRRER